MILTNENLKFDIPENILKQYKIREESKFTPDDIAKNQDINLDNQKLFGFPDITILIPFHYDTDDRLNNLIFVSHYIKYFISCNKIMVCEMDGNKPRFLEYRNKYKLDWLNYNYINQKFSKTTLINKMVNTVDTKYFMIWDTDILLSQPALTKIEQILSMSLDIDGIIPYNGKYVELDKNTILSKKINFFDRLDDIKYFSSIGLDRFSADEYIGTGGCVLFKTESFRECGEMNEWFTRWGYEDDEIIYRMQTLGKNIYRMNDSSPIYHIEHDVLDDENSFGFDHTHDNSEFQKKEYQNIKNLDYCELKEQVRLWNNIQ